jgi:hypothetical protein
MQTILKSTLVTGKLDLKFVSSARQSYNVFWQGCARASKVCLAYGETNHNRWITPCVIHPIMREQSLSTKLRNISRALDLTFEGATSRGWKIIHA